MGFLSVRLITDAARAEAMADALIEGGALSASIEDAAAGTPEEEPQFGEPGEITTPGWSRSAIVALFLEDAEVAAVVADCASALGLATPGLEISPVEDQNWVQLTQAQFEPIQVSQRLWIVPSWHDAPDPDAVNLVLDPGMAFGTGSHPTTRLCLEWLEAEVKPGLSLLDYGCGSGILAIAAGRLGAHPVVGIDIDPLAVEAARDNAQRNGVDARFVDGDSALGPAGTQFDLVVANILANPLRVLAPVLAAAVRPGGKLALAGLLDSQAEELIAIYAPWLTLAVRDSREGWSCLAGTKPPAP